MARYRIVPERSVVVIAASSSVHPINTRTDGLEGFVEIDVDGDGHVSVDEQTKGELSLRVKRMKSGNPLEDRELLRRIDARHFPTIDGRMTSIQEAGENGRYLVCGDLTFRGVTQSCEDEIVIRALDDRTVQIEGESEFDVRDFGMEPPRILMLRVHPDVKVRIDVVAERDD